MGSLWGLHSLRVWLCNIFYVPQNKRLYLKPKTIIICVWLKKIQLKNFLQIRASTYSIDLIHKWLPTQYYFVLVQISLPSLTLEQEFFSV